MAARPEDREGRAGRPEHETAAEASEMQERRVGEVDAGLRQRMPYERRRIHSQHTQLGTLHEEVVLALDRDEVHTASRLFGHFEEALEAHLEVEERIYFPAVHGLVPRLASEIADLVGEHETIRAELPSIASLLRSGETEISRELLQSLAELLSEHERREEAMLVQTARSPVGRS